MQICYQGAVPTVLLNDSLRQNLVILVKICAPPCQTALLTAALPTWAPPLHPISLSLSLTKIAGDHASGGVAVGCASFLRRSPPLTEAPVATPICCRLLAPLGHPLRTVLSTPASGTSSLPSVTLMRASSLLLYVTVAARPPVACARLLPSSGEGRWWGGERSRGREEK